MEFMYGHAKSVANLAKHGIDFEDAQRVWDNSTPVTLVAANTDDNDMRYIVLSFIKSKHWTATTSKRSDRSCIILVPRSRKTKRRIPEQRR